MEEHFEQRTKEHIDRVKKNMMSLVGYHGFGEEELRGRADEHDQLKYSKEERDPYVWLSWMHHCKKTKEPFEYPEWVEAKV